MNVKKVLQTGFILFNMLSAHHGYAITNGANLPYIEQSFDIISHPVRRDFPNFFDALQDPNEALSLIHQSFVSILKRTEVQYIRDGNVCKNGFFQHLYLQAQEILPHSEVYIAAGMVRSIFGYIYKKIYNTHERQGNLAPNRDLVLEAFDRIIYGKRRVRLDQPALNTAPKPLSPLTVLGIGSDYDILVDSPHNQDSSQLGNLKLQLTEMINSFENHFMLRDQNSDFKRIIVAIADVKEYNRQFGDEGLRSAVGQGGSWLDWLAFPLSILLTNQPENGIHSFRLPEQYPDIMDKFIQGITRYIAPNHSNCPPAKQTIRGLRALLEIPFLMLDDDSSKQLTREIQNIIKSPHLLSNDAKSQFEKMLRNGRFGAAHNRFNPLPGDSPSMPDNLELIESIRKLSIEHKSEESKLPLLPSFLTSERIALRRQDKGNLKEQGLLMSEDDLKNISTNSDLLYLYHGTPDPQHLFSMIRNGYIISSKTKDFTQGTAAYGSGFYTTTSLTESKKYIKEKGVSASFIIKKDARILSDKKFNSQTIQDIFKSFPIESDKHLQLKNQYDIDIIYINSFFLVLNADSIVMNKKLDCLLLEWIETIFSDLQRLYEPPKTSQSDKEDKRYLRLLEDSAINISSLIEIITGEGNLSSLMRQLNCNVDHTRYKEFIDSIFNLACNEEDINYLIYSISAYPVIIQYFIKPIAYCEIPRVQQLCLQLYEDFQKNKNQNSLYQAACDSLRNLDKRITTQIPESIASVFINSVNQDSITEQDQEMISLITEVRKNLNEYFSIWSEAELSTYILFALCNQDLVQDILNVRLDEYITNLLTNETSLNLQDKSINYQQLLENLKLLAENQIWSDHLLNVQLVSKLAEGSFNSKVFVLIKAILGVVGQLTFDLDNMFGIVESLITGNTSGFTLLKKFEYQIVNDVQIAVALNQLSSVQQKIFETIIGSSSSRYGQISKELTLEFISTIKRLQYIDSLEFFGILDKYIKRIHFDRNIYGLEGHIKSYIEIINKNYIDINPSLLQSPFLEEALNAFEKYFKNDYRFKENRLNTFFHHISSITQNESFAIDNFIEKFLFFVVNKRSLSNHEALDYLDLCNDLTLEELKKLTIATTKLTLTKRKDGESQNSGVILEDILPIIRSEQFNRCEDILEILYNPFADNKFRQDPYSHDLNTLKSILDKIDNLPNVGINVLREISMMTYNYDLHFFFSVAPYYENADQFISLYLFFSNGKRVDFSQFTKILSQKKIYPDTSKRVENQFEALTFDRVAIGNQFAG